MTTPAGFIPSPLDHATPPQGQAVQAAGPVGPTPIGHSPSAAAPWPRPNSAPLTAAAGQASTAAGPAAPLQMNGVDANTQPAPRPLAVQANGREFGIAPTTPGRGSQLSPPFKLVAPNSDMKEIPATFVAASQGLKPSTARNRNSASAANKPTDRPHSAHQEPSGSTPRASAGNGPVFQPTVAPYRPSDAYMVNGHGNAAPAPQPLLLPNGHVLHQIAPLTPEQLAELAQNTQLKNQLYAQLLYRSMAQTAPGQPPLQLQQLLNLSQPLLLAQPGQQQPIMMAPPGVPPGDLVQNLLMMPMRQAPQPAPAAAKPASAPHPQPAASAQPGASHASQSQAIPALSPPLAGTALQPVAASAWPGQEVSAHPAATGGSMTALGQQPGAHVGGAGEAAVEAVDKALPDASMTGGGAATSPADIQAVQAADEEAAALPSNAAASVLGESLSAGPKAPDTNLASSSSGNAPADGGVKAEETSGATAVSRGAQDATKPPLIIRNWGSVGGGFVPFGAGQQKIAPKGGKILPQGSVKAKPSAAIGAALGPNLVLPNGNVSGPRACAPVEAFELPGSVAKTIPAPSTISGGPSNDEPAPTSTSPPPLTSALAQSQVIPRPETPGLSSAVPGARPPLAAPSAPKAKPNKSRAQLEGEERKRGPAGRTSMYKGVTKHRRSGRWEAHVWVREDGKQAYLGGYSTEEEAAEAHDVAALKCHGLKAKTNFHISRYTALLDRLDTVPMAELVMAIRRTSPGFTRGSSSFRGVTQHKSGRWEVRIGLRGSKHVYLGLHTSEVEAARVYDRALVLLTGQTAATNFPVSNYKNQMEAYEQRLTKGEELPGFQEDGEYSERAFEAWLREQAILPAQEEPASVKAIPQPRSPEAAAIAAPFAASAEEGDAPKSEAPKPPVPRRTAPERKRKPPAALLDNDSEGSSPPALALNGSPRPGAKRKRSALVPKRPRASQHVTDGMLNLSNVGKPKHGRPGSRRKASDPSDDDTAAILMNLAAVAGEASGRPGSAHSPGFRHPGTFSDLPSWGRSRGSKRPRDDDDVEISDDEDEMAAGWSPGRRQHSGSFPDQVAEAMREGEDPDLAHHVFVPPSALILGEPGTADEARPVLNILKKLGATAAEIPPEPQSAELGQWELLTAWLGVCSVVGHMAHTMAVLAMQYGTAK
ncbi:hypothetical protein CVIRNUC_010044 [Coccomyxa viridis]|uniref:AP2/ERF domain-containing protein n=1 Tax=Coccomyxa viridis TaxID=1274662 RepID=A0AAV1ILA5_9CHLO|nr:hypothetical protein CVIRNUC_010044 [Coccomyxa viridis]